MKEFSEKFDSESKINTNSNANDIKNIDNSTVNIYHNVVNNTCEKNENHISGFSELGCHNKINKVQETFELNQDLCNQEIQNLKKSFQKLSKNVFDVAKNKTPEQIKENDEYDTCVFQALERGNLPKHLSFQTVFRNSLDTLINKPENEKFEIEKKIDRIFKDYLPDSIMHADISVRKANSNRTPQKNLKETFLEEPINPFANKSFEMNELNSLEMEEDIEMNVKRCCQTYQVPKNLISQINQK